MGKFEKNFGTSRKNICKLFFSSHVERCFELFSRVGSGGFPNAQNEARGAVGAVHASQESGGKGLGWFRMVLDGLGWLRKDESEP